jgi:hypothetical protein
VWFRRNSRPFKDGNTFDENINQGGRWCRVTAVDEETGDYLYDYEMPNGRVFMRTCGPHETPTTAAPAWRTCT